MTKLCVAYKHTFPISQLAGIESEYYNSKLGDISTQKFTQLIDKAKMTIHVKNRIPSTEELINLIPSLDTKEYDYTNYHGCPKCTKTGIITMVAPDRYEYAFACDCQKGILRQNQNHNKKGIEPRYMAVYTKALNLGYTIKKYFGTELSQNQKERAKKLINIVKRTHAATQGHQNNKVI